MSSKFSKSSESSDSSKFSKSSESSDSSKFSESNEISRSSESSDSSKFSESNEISRSNESSDSSKFSESNEISRSNESSDSSKFSESNEISRSNKSNESSESNESNESNEFSKIFSKVILSGEHSVLRGGYAVVAPNKNYFLEYDLKKAERFSLVLSDKESPYEVLFLGLIESALILSKTEKKDLNVRVEVKTIVPLGEGLGGSAALCVFVARVFLFANLLEESEAFSFAHEIENIFHDQSSGLDVAGCMSDQIIFYQRGVKKIQELKPELKGYSFTIHRTGEKGETKDCIEQVLKLRGEDKNLFNSLDDKMSEASIHIREGLESGNLSLVMKSFKETTDIFRSWGLISFKIEQKMEEIKNLGALSVRLTGSGQGGCVVAIWLREKIPEKFISSVFLNI